MSQPQNKNIVETTIRVGEIKGDSVKLEFAEGFIELPKKVLPQGVKSDDELILTISAAAFHQQNKEKQAKDILNEILSAE